MTQMKLFINASPVQLEKEFNEWIKPDYQILSVQTNYSPALQKFFTSVVWNRVDPRLLVMEEEDGNGSEGTPEAGK